MDGYFTMPALEAWRAEERPFGVVQQVSPDDLARQQNGRVTIVDVRRQAEWNVGHLPDALHIPLGYLSERLDEIPHDRRVIAYCQSGARSAIAASLLQAHGFSEVGNLIGGYAAVDTAIPSTRASG